MEDSHKTVRSRGSMRSEPLLREFLHLFLHKKWVHPKNVVLGSSWVGSQRRPIFLFMFHIRSEHFPQPTSNGAQILLWTRSHIQMEGLGTKYKMGAMQTEIFLHWTIIKKPHGLLCYRPMCPLWNSWTKYILLDLIDLRVEFSLPLMSKGHLSVIWAGPVDELVVLTNLNWTKNQLSVSENLKYLLLWRHKHQRWCL